MPKRLAAADPGRCVDCLLCALACSRRFRTPLGRVSEDYLRRALAELERIIGGENGVAGSP